MLTAKYDIVRSAISTFTKIEVASGLERVFADY